MKKLIAIAFTCVYLLLTVGVIKNIYCTGRINSPLLVQETRSSSQIEIADKTSKGSPEFFIISGLYSEALVIFLA